MSTLQFPELKGGYATGKKFNVATHCFCFIDSLHGGQVISLNADISAEVIGIVLVKKTY